MDITRKVHNLLTNYLDNSVVEMNFSPNQKLCPTCRVNNTYEIMNNNFNVFLTKQICVKEPSPICLLRCKECEEEWYACSLCTKCKKTWSTEGSVYSHLYSKHRTLIIKVEKNTNTLVLETTKFNPHALALMFNTEEEHKYHVHNLTNNGNEYLVVRSNYRTQEVQSILNFDKEELYFQLQIAIFMNNLTRLEQEKFALILKDIENNYRKKLEDIQNWAYRFSVVPNSMAALNSFYLSGVDSIFENLPSPKSKRLDTLHVYMGLRNSIKSMLSFDSNFKVLLTNNYQMHPDKSYFQSKSWIQIHTNPIEYYDCNKRVTLFYESPAVLYWLFDTMKKNPAENILFLPLIEFSDDCDPYGSLYSGRFSIWNKIVNVAPNKNNMHLMSCLCPILYSMKNENHKIVEQRYKEELISLSDPLSDNNIMYVKKLGKCYRMRVVQILTLQDQVELRSCLSLTMGNLLFHIQKGFSCNFHLLSNKLPPCDLCLKNLFFQNYKAIDNCVKCLCFNIEVGNNNIKNELLKYVSLPNYPVKTILRPFRLSYDKIIMAIDESKKKYAIGAWSYKNCQSYLGTYCVNGKLVEKIIKPIRVNKQQGNNQDIEQDNIMNNNNNQIEAMWSRGTYIEQHINIVMHVLFLGITRYIVKQSLDSFQLFGKKDIFINDLSALLVNVGQLKIDWLDNIPLNKGKITGWVSSNYMAVGRICSWWLLCMLTSTGNNKCSNKISWIAACNFMSCLNLPSQVALYGPIYDHFESAGLGEKLIHLAKQQFNCYFPNWDVILLQKVVDDIIIKKLCKQCDGYMEPTRSERNHASFKIYRFLSNIETSWTTMEPVSAVLGYDDRYYICWEVEAWFNIYHVRYNGKYCGNHYHYWLIDYKKIYTITDYKDYLCFLPKLVEKRIGLYTIISKEYKVVDIDGGLDKNYIELNDIIN